MRTKFLVIIAAILIVSCGGFLLSYRLFERKFTDKEDKFSVLTQAEINAILPFCESFFTTKSESLTTEDTQVLVKNNIVSQKEAESLLKLEKLLSPESKEEER